ncbi:MAG: WxL protein peptidoglycan domain-containing protein [Vagococcus sp.]
MKNKSLTLIGTMVTILCLVFFIDNYMVEAEEGTLNFTYENELPKNQIGDKTYFELKVKPKDTQTLVTKVTNKSKKKRTIIITVSNATTSPTGDINYGPNKKKLVGKKPLRLTDMIEYPNQVILKPGEMKKVRLKLTVPKEPFDGIVLGGVHLKEESKKKERSIEEGASLENEYSYVYSISLKETDKKIEPVLTSTGSVYNQKVYTAINNPQPIILSDIQIDSQLMTEDSDKVLKDSTLTGYRMAPNSSLDIPFEGTEDLDVGMYRTKTIVTIKEQKWTFDNKFEVTKENKESYKKELFEETPKEKRLNWFVMLLVVLLFVGTTIAIFLGLIVFKKKH